MKKSAHVLICPLLSVVLTFSFAFSSSAAKANETDLITSAADLLNSFDKYKDNLGFGGIFYNNDGRLVLNVVKGPLLTNRLNGWKMSGVTVNEVSFSLGELEYTKDSLEPYMSTHSIVVLDANEMTNKVDAYLSDYNNVTIQDIEQLSSALGMDPNVLNFIDYSDTTILFSVGME